MTAATSLAGWKMNRVISRLNLQSGRGLWTLRAVSETAVLAGGFHCAWLILTYAFCCATGERYAVYRATILRLAECVAILLPWFVVAGMAQTIHRVLERRRAGILAECSVQYDEILWRLQHR